MDDRLLDGTWLTKSAGEIRDIAAEDGSILIVPVGSLEQHGEHLPTGTDTILATAAARSGIESLENDLPTMLSPPLWAGYSPHHLPFGGTITVEHDTFVDTITEIVASAAENGFDAVVFVNGHGGNKSLLSTAITVAGREHPDVEVSTFLYLDLLSSELEDIKRSDVPGVHGGELETALLLSVRPDLVDEERTSTTPQEEPYERAGADLLNGGPVSVYRPFDEYTDTGTLGEPGAATDETGKRALEVIGEEIAAVLDSVHEHVRTDGR